MNNFTFIFLVFFLFHGSTKGFDYWKITQTWPLDFCHESPCIPGKENLMKFTFMVYGHPPTPSHNQETVEIRHYLM